MRVNQYDGVVDAMAHCGGGPSCDRFELFEALVDWVERGIEPYSESESDCRLQVVEFTVMYLIFRQ